MRRARGSGGAGRTEVARSETGEGPYLGSADEAPPSSLSVSESSGSPLEPSRPRCGTGRCRGSTAGGPWRTTASLNRDERTGGSTHVTKRSASLEPTTDDRSWWRSTKFGSTGVLTAVLLLLWTQEIRQTVGDPLHLLHLRVLHPPKMEDPSISWRNLTVKRTLRSISSLHKFKLHLAKLFEDFQLPDKKKNRAGARQVWDAAGKILPDSCSDASPPLLPPGGQT